MPKTPAGFVYFKRAARQYNVSRSTLDRRRDKAREEDDSKTYECFLVRTRSGGLLRAPSKDQVDQLVKKGEAPHWYVSKAWLEKEYGLRKRPEQGSEQSDPTNEDGDREILAALREQYEARIADLKEQLAVAHVEKKEIRQEAHEDKRLFAKGLENMTHMAALPGIAEAARAQRGDALVDAVRDPGPAEQTDPTVRQREQDSPPQPAPKSDDAEASSKPKRRFWKWFTKSAA